jgi:hypothetical protein
MVERTPSRPIPEGELKQNAPAAGAGPLGIPPPTPEHSPLPRMLNILERKAQLEEDEMVGRMTYHEAFAKRAELRDEQLSLLQDNATDRDRLIFDLYDTLLVERMLGKNPTSSTQPVQLRELIARVKPMSEDELREELYKAQEALQGDPDRYRRMVATRELYKTLPPEEAAEKRQQARREYAREYVKTNIEKVRAQQRRYRQERKERRRLQAEEQQPPQVFPPPTQE